MQFTSTQFATTHAGSAVHAAASATHSVCKQSVHTCESLAQFDPPPWPSTMHPPAPVEAGLLPGVRLHAASTSAEAAAAARSAARIAAYSSSAAGALRRRTAGAGFGGSTMNVTIRSLASKSCR